MKNVYIAINLHMRANSCTTEWSCICQLFVFIHHYNNLSLMEPAIMCVLNCLTNDILDSFTFQHIIPDNGSSITNACFPNVLMNKLDMVMF